MIGLRAEFGFRGDRVGRAAYCCPEVPHALPWSRVRSVELEAAAVRKGRRAPAKGGRGGPYLAASADSEVAAGDASVDA